MTTSKIKSDWTMKECVKRKQIYNCCTKINANILKIYMLNKNKLEQHILKILKIQKKELTSLNLILKKHKLI